MALGMFRLSSQTLDLSWLERQLNGLQMPQQNSMPRFRPVIRVFVSSTFSDLQPERNALQAQVFSKLEQLCAQNGVLGKDEGSIMNDENLSMMARERARHGRCELRPRGSIEVAWFFPAARVRRVGAPNGSRGGCDPHSVCLCKVA